MTDKEAAANEESQDANTELESQIGDDSPATDVAAEAIDADAKVATDDDTTTSTIATAESASDETASDENEDAGASDESDEDAKALADTESAIFVGRWRGLVSTTNWEKGRVIAEWRKSLVDAGASPSEYSDEAWGRRVGRITPQHVGRLRRVHEKYGDSRESFEGLFWSHFHATIDWDDAEMWLEGAVQNGWSVSKLRHQRWEAMGGDEGNEPQDADIVSTEEGEDIDIGETQPLSTVDSRLETVEGFNKEERPSDGDEADDLDDDMDDLSDSAEPAEPQPLVRPFADLPELPDDLADAFDDMKLAILRHKVNEWAEISLEEVMMSLDALKQLAAAPSESATAS